MAPEFFGFLAVPVLLLAGLALVAFTLIPERFRERAFGARTAMVLRTARWACVISFILAGVIAFGVRQAFFLDEPMASAARAGDIATVRKLLAEGASPNAYGVDGMETAINAAADGGHHDIVRILLETGADPNRRDWQNQTALQRAKSNGDPETIRILLSYGAKE